MIKDAESEKRTKSLANKKSLDALKPREQKYTLRVATNLYIVVEPTGAKSWLFRGNKNGEEQTKSLGKYSDLSLTDAAKTALDLKKKVRAGVDLKEEEREKKRIEEATGESVESVAREWLETTSRRRVWKENTLTKVTRQLEMYLIEPHGHRAFAALKVGDIDAIITDLSIKKNLRPLAAKMREHLIAIYSRAQARGIVDRNLMIDFKDAFEKPIHYKKQRPTITDPDRVGQLIRDIRSYGSPITRAALLLNFLLFQRSSETRQMRWDQIDFENFIWTVPAAAMKGKLVAKLNNQVKDHMVPLSTQAMKILLEVKALRMHETLVFPSQRGDGRVMSENTLNVALKSLGYDTKTDICAHGARAMARTMMPERLGMLSEPIERQLAHKSSEILGDTYDRAPLLAQRRLTMQAWADYLDALAENRGHEYESVFAEPLAELRKRQLELMKSVKAGS